MIVSSILSRLRAWKLYRETVNELSELTDRELADVGVSRWEIHSVARKSAFAVSADVLRGRDERSSGAGTKRPLFHAEHATI